MQIILRERDWSPLVTLWIEAWKATMPAIDFCARAAWLEAHLASGVTVLCAEQAGAVLGFATLDEGTLEQLAVAPCVFGRGVATRLLDAAKMRGGALRLSVNQDNARAVRFYLREEFRITGAGVNAGSGLAIWDMAWDQKSRE